MEEILFQPLPISSANLVCSSPYKVGQVILLKTAIHPRSIGFEQQVRIEKLYEPCTLSCVMEVSYLGFPDDPARPVLKLYDWRFAAQLRKDNKIDPWTKEHEAAYIDFVRSGKAKGFLDKLRNDEDFEEPEEGWNMAENETYLYNICADMFRAETAVYEKLDVYQGNQIPGVVGRASLSIDSSNERSSDRYDVASIKHSSPDIASSDVYHVDIEFPETDFLKVNGILIERVEGFTLASLTQHSATRSFWQFIIDRAIRIVHLLSDNDILNEDVRASNILVSPRPDGNYRVCMIDFAQCRFRRKDESDLEWGRAKWRQDEEGAIGYVMKCRLAKEGFELKYEPSMRYLEYAEREEETAS